MKTIREGQFGKATIRVVEIAGKYAGIVLLDGKVRSRLDGKEVDELWSLLQKEVATTSPDYFGFDGARSRFLRIFEGGFASPNYLSSERAYKMAAKEKLDSLVPLELAAESEGCGEEILAVYRATNLLSPFEKVRMQEALRGPNADRFIRGAASFTIGKIDEGLRDMAAALKPYDAAKWTAITYLPFLWRPDEHMFLKPEVTKMFAERVGHQFFNTYSPELNPAVYENLLDLAVTTEGELEGIHPQDRIDIQSFIWVVGAYTLEDELNILAQ